MERKFIVLWHGLANRSRVDLAHHLCDGRSTALPQRPQPNGAAANDRECQRDGAQASQEQQRIDRGHPV
jgi:hypothetical protein